MKIKLLLLPLTIILAFPVLALARPVSFTAELAPYSGDGAYIALYLTDAQGQYRKTLWIAGNKSKYYKHLADWAHGSGLRPAEYDGMTGASVRSGQTLSKTLEIDDTLIDAGYRIHIDTAVEDKRDNRSEVVVPLTTDGAGKATAGKGYIKSFTYSF